MAPLLRFDTDEQQELVVGECESTSSPQALKGDMVLLVELLEEKMPAEAVLEPERL